MKMSKRGPIHLDDEARKKNDGAVQRLHACVRACVSANVVRVPFRSHPAPLLEK